MSGLPGVTFTFAQGAKGQPLPNFDRYSAMIGYYYAGSANSAYAGIGDATYFSVKDAEDDGVVNTFAEATAATSTQTVTATGADGDTTVITFVTQDGTTVTLGSYLKITADNTVTLVATGIVAGVNALTYLTGFTATVGSTGAYTITAPKSLGIYPNTKSVVNTITGTTAITNVAFASGTRSNLAMFHYQISEFFRGQPNGVLYFSIKLDNSGSSIGTYNTQVQTDGLAVLMAFKGQARQALVYNPFRTFATSTLTSLKALRTTLVGQQIPCVFGYVGGFTGTLAAQANTRALTADGVTAIIGQGLSGTALEYSRTQYSVICQGGTWLGSVASVSVSSSIGEPQAIQLSDGAECEVAGFFDGTDYEAISTSLANQLHDYGYTFLRKLPNTSGTYWNAGNAAIAPSSDYAYIEDSRTIDKMQRDVYGSIVVLLNRKNSVNADGTLSTASIAAYNEKIDVALGVMVRDEDLSNYSKDVSTTAVVATTGIIPITITGLQEVIGRQISITLGFAAKL